MNAWRLAYDTMGKRIRSHPDFKRLVREVAVAEQGSHPGHAWYQRNSSTYGSWVTRGMPRVRTGKLNRRAYLLAGKISEALELYPDLPREAEARVYVEASHFVRQRRLP